MSSLEKFEEWINAKYVYKENGKLDKEATKNHFLNVCNNGSVEIKAIASETGITRSVFYQNNAVVERLTLLRKNLNKQFPKQFTGLLTKKGKGITKRIIETNENDGNGTKIYNQDSSKLLTLTRYNAALEKQLHEEKAKNTKLEKDLESLQKKLKQYAPSIKALFELGAFPAPSKMTISEDH